MVKTPFTFQVGHGQVKDHCNWLWYTEYIKLPFSVTDGESLTDINTDSPEIKSTINTKSDTESMLLEEEEELDLNNGTTDHNVDKKQPSDQSLASDQLQSALLDEKVQNDNKLFETSSSNLLYTDNQNDNNPDTLPNKDEYSSNGDIESTNSTNEFQNTKLSANNNNNTNDNNKAKKPLSIIEKRLKEENSSHSNNNRIPRKRKSVDTAISNEDNVPKSSNTEVRQSPRIKPKEVSDSTQTDLATEISNENKDEIKSSVPVSDNIIANNDDLPEKKDNNQAIKQELLEQKIKLAKQMHILEHEFDIVKAEFLDTKLHELLTEQELINSSKNRIRTKQKYRWIYLGK